MSNGLVAFVFIMSIFWQASVQMAQVDCGILRPTSV